MENIKLLDSFINSASDESSKVKLEKKKSIPFNDIMDAISLMEIVLFPGSTQTIEFFSEHSLNALKNAEKHGGGLILLTTHRHHAEKPKAKDLSRIGNIAKIVSITTSYDETKTKVVFELLYRVKVSSYVFNDNKELVKANVEKLESSALSKIQEKALIRIIDNALKGFIAKGKEIVDLSYDAFMKDTSLDTLIDSLSAIVIKNFDAKLKIFESTDNTERTVTLVNALDDEIEFILLQHSISQKVNDRIQDSQRDYYLREQMRVISQELGETSDEINEYREKISALEIKDDKILDKLYKEINRLTRLSPSSAESAITRTYLDWIIDLPWKKSTRENINIKKAREILDRDHYGLETVKERVLEFLSVHSLTKKMSGTILCLVGPPGVGKTSIAHSIAKAMNKNFVRMSLGGIKDEAEIRGHRRTYIGAMPGRIIYNMRSSNTINPLFLLDEIDKMTNDFRGDPASALLEVLDPSVNQTFRDHFLEVPYDLSNVFFIATANSYDTIPEPLLDRMEIIEISGYTDEEKLQIAKRYLIFKAQKANGLLKFDIDFTDRAILDVINHYTRESGVRNLEREISNIMRKLAVKYLENKSMFDSKFTVDSNVSDYLGVYKFTKEQMNATSEVGACLGLAWTSVGGTTLTVEVSLMRGNGDILLTGKLGDVMKESARTALSYIQSRASEYGIDDSMFSDHNIHVHVPEGATPKDGPSAGITIATSILSALIGKKVDHTVAMTGEITLRGRVLPIGGLKEKILAAFRVGVKKIIIPKENEANLKDVPEDVLKDLEIVLVENVSDVFKNAIIGL